MRYLVKIGDLGRKIDFLEKQLSIIDENIDNLNKIKSTIIWEGEAYNSFINKYDEHIKELNQIENNITTFIKYLEEYHDKYGTRYSTIRRKYNNSNGGK